MKVPGLKNALRQRGLRVSGRKAQLVSRLTLSVRAARLPPRSVWYFMSTTGLCDYARDSLGLCGGIYSGLDQLMKAAGSRGQ